MCQKQNNKNKNKTGAYSEVRTTVDLKLFFMIPSVAGVEWIHHCRTSGSVLLAGPNKQPWELRPLTGLEGHCWYQAVWPAPSYSMLCETVFSDYPALHGSVLHSTFDSNLRVEADTGCAHKHLLPGITPPIRPILIICLACFSYFSIALIKYNDQGNL